MLKLPAPETSRLSTGEVISRFYICLNNYSEYQLYTNPVIVVNKSDLGGNLNESFRCPLSSLILEDGKYYLNYENSKFTMFGGDRYFAYVTADGVEDSDIITL